MPSLQPHRRTHAVLPLACVRSLGPPLIRTAVILFRAYAHNFPSQNPSLHHICKDHFSTLGFRDEELTSLRVIIQPTMGVKVDPPRPGELWSLMTSMLVKARSSSHWTHSSLVLLLFHWPLLFGALLRPRALGRSPCRRLQVVASLCLHASNGGPDLTLHTSPRTQLSISTWVSRRHLNPTHAAWTPGLPPTHSTHCHTPHRG